MKSLLLISVFLFSSIGFASDLDCVLVHKITKKSTVLKFKKGIQHYEGLEDDTYQAKDTFADVEVTAKIKVERSGVYRASIESSEYGHPGMKNSATGSLADLAMEIYTSDKREKVVVSNMLGKVVCK